MNAKVASPIPMWAALSADQLSEIKCFSWIGKIKCACPGRKNMYAPISTVVVDELTLDGFLQVVPPLLQRLVLGV